jgi:hypothetical protein
MYIPQRKDDNMNYHTTIPDASTTDFQLALQKSLSLPSAEIAIVAHSIQILKMSDVGSVLGLNTVQDLKNFRIAKTANKTIHLVTEKIFPSDFNGTLLAPYVSLELLAEAVTALKPADVVYLPLSDKELKEYLANNNSRPI